MSEEAQGTFVLPTPVAVQRYLQMKVESIINTEPPNPSADNHFWSSSRYGPITGMVAERTAPRFPGKDAGR